jgi:hypothetical protein
MQVEWEGMIFEAAMRDLDLMDEGDERPMASSVADRQDSKQSYPRKTLATFLDQIYASFPFF